MYLQAGFVDLNSYVAHKFVRLKMQQETTVNIASPAEEELETLCRMVKKKFTLNTAWMAAYKMGGIQ